MKGAGVIAYIIDKGKIKVLLVCQNVHPAIWHAMERAKQLYGEKTPKATKHMDTWFKNPENAKYKKEVWSFPKGHIEKGEEPIVTALREFKEEIYRGAPIKLNKDQKMIFSDRVFYVYNIDPKDLKPDGREIIGYIWLDIDDIQKFKEKNEVNNTITHFNVDLFKKLIMAPQKLFRKFIQSPKKSKSKSKSKSK